MNWGIIFVSRDRVDTMRQVLPRWLEQDLPILILTEPGQVARYKKMVHEDLEIKKEIVIAGHPKRNKGVGYARMRSVEVAQTFGVDAFVLSDDDMIITKGNVRKLLRFVDDERSIICAGWMPNYGLWVPDGNKIGKEDNLVIPCGGARDRVMAINTALALAAGNFHPGLKWLDTQEMNRRGIRAGHLWYIHSGVHIAMINKPRDPGGIQAVFKTEEEREKQGRKDHETVYKLWGPKYISQPPKRMATRWLKMAEDFIGPKAAEVLKESRAYPDNRVTNAIRMFGRR